MDLPEDQRLRLWAALAWPYLDTEPSEKDWAEVAADLRASGLSVETLKRLQVTVVAPVLRGQAYYGRWMGLAAVNERPAHCGYRDEMGGCRADCASECVAARAVALVDI